MTQVRPIILTAISLLVGLDCATRAKAGSGTPPPLTKVRYQITTVALPGAQFENCFVNDEGTASGSFFDAANHQHGFIWQNDQVTVVDSPGFPGFGLNGLNNRGVIGGSDGFVPLLYQIRNQTSTKLPAIAGFVAIAARANNQGLVLGSALDENGLNAAGWTWDGTQYSFFTVPEADGAAGGTLPQGINDLGQIVGIYFDNLDIAHGFLKEGSVFTTIDISGADGTFPVGINNKGDIAGFYVLNGPPSAIYGFLIQNGSVVTVDILGSPFCGMSQVNDRGDLSGLYFDESGNAKGFVARPQP